MAKLSFVSCIIIFLLSFAGNNVIMVKVSGENCREDLGACDAGCFGRCKKAHPKGRGSCVGMPICRCLFDECKSCVETLGKLGTCVPDDCRSACVAKHPYTRAEGYCYKVGAPSGHDCLCDYDCW